jgi:hypothetical protein
MAKKKKVKGGGPEFTLRPNCRGKLVPVSSNTLALTPDKLTDSLSIALHQPSELVEGATKMEVIAAQVVGQAEYGDLHAVDMVFDRVVGKPKQTSMNFNANATGTFSGFLRALHESRQQNVPVEEILERENKTRVKDVTEIEKTTEETVRDLF